MQKFDIKEIWKKTSRKLAWENIESPEDEGIKVKEESTIGIGKDNVDPNILLTDSTSNVPMK
eukprot:7075971-Ditylum_brightwellii.AAC.1